ncbi:hypothetical protein TNCV_2913831 [Trichonephila clavipes]|nr:hypothetical protein TNCV_2913831 [Trichonephila clavipes]
MRPILAYGCPVWGYAAKTNINILDTLQNSTIRMIEDFGKRNMPGKRARRHFSQLSEFERGQIIGMKTAGWSTRRELARGIVRSVPLEIVGSSGHEKVPTRGKPGLERPGRPRGERIEGSCGKHL